jgi:glyceraldehyde-3-phosphate dehydrogenase (ferredoxin)
MDKHLKVLHIDASSAFYRVERFPVGPFWGPVDLGLHLTGREAGRQGVLNFGTGLLAGSILPGSNRLIFTGHSPCCAARPSRLPCWCSTASTAKKCRCR